MLADFQIGWYRGKRKALVPNYGRRVFICRKVVLQMSYQLPRGTYDIMDDEIEKWHWMEEIIHDLCQRSHYTEIRTPIFEQTELYIRGVVRQPILLVKRCILFPIVIIGV